MEILQLISRESLQLIRDGFVSSRTLSEKGSRRDSNNALREWDSRALETIESAVFCSVLLEHFEMLYMLYKDYLPSTTASNPHGLKNVETHVNLQRKLTYFFSLSQAGRVNELFLLFDTIDIDSIGTISWTDVSTFFLRVARITQVPSQVYRIPNYKPPTAMSPPIFCSKVYCCPDLKTLYVIDREFSIVTSFTSTIAFDIQHDPVKAFERFLAIKKSTKKSYVDMKEIGKGINNTTPDLWKVGAERANTKITCMTFVDRHNYLVFCTSNSGILTCNSKTFKHVGHSMTKEVQVGIIYCSGLDLLLTWSDGIHNDVLIWDAMKTLLLYSVTRHSSCILDLCLVESPGTSFVASCDIDRQVFLWSLESVEISLGRKKPGKFNAPLLCRNLLGHENAIRRLCYAKENKLILGAGFDWDIYGWDPEEGILSMRLSGHMGGNLSLFTVVVGTERVVTYDTEGLLKVWNITSIDVGSRAVTLYTLSLSFKETSLRIEEVSPAFGNGSTLACRMLDRIAFCELPDAGDLFQVVPGGVGVSRRLRRHWVVSPEQIKFTFGAVTKTMTIKEFDTSDANPLQHIVLSEVVTVATTDFLGKKIILGTSRGTVKVYDSGAFGLQRVCIPANADHIPVVGLHYVDSDKLIVVTFSTGDVKIANCAIKAPTGSRSKSDNISPLLVAESIGVRNPPPSLIKGGFVLRECSYNMRPGDDTTGMAMSESLSLIATYNKSGCVCVIDYCSLDVVCAYHLPPMEGRTIQTLRFLPSAPVMLLGDSIGKVSAYTVRPLAPAWLLTFSVEKVFVDDASSKGRMIFDLYSLQNASENSNFASISALETLYYKSATPREMPSTSTSSVGEGKRASGYAKRRASLKGMFLNSSIASHNNEWVIVVGNDIGYVCGIDITNLVIKAGVKVEIAKDAASLTAKISSSPFAIFDKKTVVTKDAKAHLDNPVGSQVYMENCGPFGITSSDLRAMYRFSTHRDNVTSIVIDRASKNYYNRASSTLDLIFSKQSVPMTPRYILSAFNLHDDLNVWDLTPGDSKKHLTSQEWLQLEDSAPEAVVEAYVPLWNKRLSQDALSSGREFKAMARADVDCVDFLTLQRDYIIQHIESKSTDRLWYSKFPLMKTELDDEDSWIGALDTDFQQMRATSCLEAESFSSDLMETFRTNNRIVLDGDLQEPLGNEKKLVKFNFELSLKRGRDPCDILPLLPASSLKMEKEIGEFKAQYMSPDKESARAQSPQKAARRPRTTPTTRRRNAELEPISPVKLPEPEMTLLTDAFSAAKESPVKTSTTKTDLDRIDDIFRSTIISLTHTKSFDLVNPDAESLKLKLVETVKRADWLINREEQQPLSTKNRRKLSTKSDVVRERMPKPLTFVNTSEDLANAKTVNQKITPAFKRGRYGFYSAKDMCILLRFMNQIRDNVEYNEHLGTDDNAPLFSKDTLLNHKLVRNNIAIQRTITEYLRNTKDDFDIFLSKTDIVHCMCPHSTPPEKYRICNFLTALESLHWMLCHCHPPSTEKMHWHLLGSRQSSRHLSAHLFPGASPSATAMASALATAAATDGPKVSSVEYCAIDADLPLPDALYEAASANGFKDWELAKEKYRAIATVFTRMLECKVGTVTFSDVVIIIQSMFSPSYFNRIRSLSLLQPRLLKLTDINAEVDAKGVGVVLKVLGINKLK